MQKYTDRYIFEPVTKSERTRLFIIERTAPVFNQYGYGGTSMSLLQEATGLTKGSLYGNFSDKEEIAVEAFRYSMEAVRAKVRECLSGKETAKEKLHALFSFYSRYVFEPPIPGGCPLLNNAVEADDYHVSMKDAVSEEIDQTISFIAHLLDEGKRLGEFQNDIKSKSLAYLFFTAIEGAIMVSRVSDSDASMKAVVKHCKSILDQISI